MLIASIYMGKSIRMKRVNDKVPSYLDLFISYFFHHCVIYSCSWRRKLVVAVRTDKKINAPAHEILVLIALARSEGVRQACQEPSLLA